MKVCRCGERATEFRAESKNAAAEKNFRTTSTHTPLINWTNLCPARNTIETLARGLLEFDTG